MFLLGYLRQIEEAITGEEQIRRGFSRGYRPHARCQEWSWSGTEGEISMMSILFLALIISFD